jgi:hypothetical protein
MTQMKETSSPAHLWLTIVRDNVIHWTFLEQLQMPLGFGNAVVLQTMYSEIIPPVVLSSILMVGATSCAGLPSSWIADGSRDWICAAPSWIRYCVCPQLKPCDDLFCCRSGWWTCYRLRSVPITLEYGAARTTFWRIRGGEIWLTNFFFYYMKYLSFAAYHENPTLRSACWKFDSWYPAESNRFLCGEPKISFHFGRCCFLACLHVPYTRKPFSSSVFLPDLIFHFFRYPINDSRIPNRRRMFRMRKWCVPTRLLWKKFGTMRIESSNLAPDWLLDSDILCPTSSLDACTDLHTLEAMEVHTS